jgi:beta-glucosidase
VASDDGSRLYLDGQLLVDNWGQHGLLMKAVTIDLKAGEPHDVKIEMYELEGGAGAVLSWQKVEGDPIDMAVAKARAADVALLFVGHTSSIEREGVDRGTLELPEDQVRLLQAVARANPNTVVVLNSGAAVLMGSWLGSVPALLESWFAGSETGNAVADVLFGDVNPSGRLPTTFLKRWEDAAAYGNFPGGNGVVKYAEGVFVGYRWFDKKGIVPEFPFGHGLSYTRFAYRDLTVAAVAGKPRHYEARFFVKNTGGREGAEVAQLYVRHDAVSRLERPVQELKGFLKVFLKPGEEKEVRLALDDSSLAFYDPAKKAWVVEPGEFEVRVGASSLDIRLKASVAVQ